MKRRAIKIAIFLSVCLLFNSLSFAKQHVQDVDWPGIEDFVKKTMKEWSVPGLSLAVVSGNEVIYTLGAGIRDIQNNLPVTTDTMFAIGSTSKAFTAALVGMLVDEEKLDWDTPVVHYLPSLRLYDKLASDRLTPRDLLCHRSGLPDHTLSWYARPSTREEIIARLKYLEPTTDFRNAYQYNNYMITTAGYLAGRVTGDAWEKLIQKRIFDPLAMINSTFTGSIKNPREEKDFAIPYSLQTGEVKEIPLSPAYEAVGPAGNIVSTAKDMANWLKLHLNKGIINGKQIISATTMKEIHSPQMIVGESSFYGLGWFIDYSRGYKAVSHGGGFEGYTALVSFIPKEKIALVILTNMHTTNLPTVIALNIYDSLMGNKKTDWNTIFLNQASQAKKLAKKAAEEWKKTRKPGTNPSHPVEDYTGKYINPGYGVLQIALENNTLKASFNETVSFDLEHFHYEVFSTSNIISPGREYAFPYFSASKLIFQTDAKGEVNQVAFRTNPDADKEVDIIFTRE